MNQFALAILMALFGMLSCVSAAWAQTVEIIDQMFTNGYSGGFISDTECTASSPLIRASFADDFRIQPPTGYSAMAVSSAEFVGRYQPAVAPNDPTPFIIQFRQDAGGLPGLVIAQPNASIDLAITEGWPPGTKNMSFPVVFSEAPASTVQVQWSITAGTATPGTDYLGPYGGTLTFTPSGPLGRMSRCPCWAITTWNRTKPCN